MIPVSYTHLSFQPGRERLENAGYRVESLVRIKEFKDNGCVFIED